MTTHETSNTPDVGNQADDPMRDPLHVELGQLRAENRALRAQVEHQGMLLVTFDLSAEIAERHERKINAVWALVENARKHAGGSYTAQVDALSIERALSASEPDERIVLPPDRAYPEPAGEVTPPAEQRATNPCGHAYHDCTHEPMERAASEANPCGYDYHDCPEHAARPTTEGGQ